MKKYLIIITGWHYSNNKFYNDIKRVSDKFTNADVFISSHKPMSEIDKKTLETIKKIKNCKIHSFENIGYDWGAFSQALDYLKKTKLNYKYIFFMHDDIEIKNIDFLDIFSQFIEKEKIVVAGNCKNQNQFLHPWPKTHPYIIEWARQSEWKIEISSKAWNTVRGSFFVAKKEIFKKIKKIPFKKGNNIRFGNWSLITFAGEVSDKFGKDSIKAISENYLVSPYITEYERGIKNYLYILNQSYKRILTNRFDKIISLFKKIIEKYHQMNRISTPKGGLKIHLGCGNNNLPGYLNVDASEQSCADIVCSVKNIDFKKNAISEILMHHLIEYLDKFEAEELFKKIYAWLRPKGVLIIEYPHMVKVARLVIKNKDNIVRLKNGPYGFRDFYGESVKKMENWDYPRQGYSELSLKSKLKKIGFAKIKSENPISHLRRGNHNLRIIAIKE